MEEHEFSDEHVHTPPAEFQGTFEFHVSDEEGDHYLMEFGIGRSAFSVRVMDRYGEEEFAVLAVPYPDLARILMETVR